MAERACKSSGAIASSAAITTTPCLVWAITFRSGTTAGSVVIRDGGAGGTVIWTISYAATTAAGDVTLSKTFAKPIDCATSLYVTMSGTGAEAYVAYEGST